MADYPEQPLIWTAEVVRLNNQTVIKVKHGPYIQGYFLSVQEVEAYLQHHGFSMADLEIIDNSPEETQCHSQRTRSRASKPLTALSTTSATSRTSTTTAVAPCTARTASASSSMVA